VSSSESLVFPFSISWNVFFMPQTKLFNCFLDGFIAYFISDWLSIENVKNFQAQDKNNNQEGGIKKQTS
jgi:hypothetical protein